MDLAAVKSAVAKARICGRKRIEKEEKDNGDNGEVSRRFNAMKKGEKEGIRPHPRYASNLASCMWGVVLKHCINNHLMWFQIMSHVKVRIYGLKRIEKEEKDNGANREVSRQFNAMKKGEKEWIRPHPCYASNLVSCMWRVVLKYFGNNHLMWYLIISSPWLS